jgi:hypothetical protein
MHADYDRKLQDKRQTLRRMREHLVSRQSVKEQLLREELADFARELRRVKIARIGKEAELTWEKANPAKGDEKNQARLTREVEILNIQEKALSDLVTQSAEQLSQLRSETVDFERLSEDIKQISEIVERITGQRMTLELELDVPPRVRLLEQAVAPKQ